MTVLEWPAMVARETQHFRLNAICDLAQGYIAIREGESEKGIRTLGHVTKSAERADSGHFQIYAHEGVAVGLWRMTEKPDAIEHLRSAKKLRADMNMAYTDWDQMRIRSVLPAVRIA